MTIKRPNFYFLFCGIFSIIMFVISFYFSWTDRNIRLNGELRKERIVEISGRISRPHGSALIIINNEMLNAGSISVENRVGDSIFVRYVSGGYCVVQESVNPNRYYLYFTLESLLLIVGIAFIIESLKGRSYACYQERTIDFYEVKDKFMKWITGKSKK